MRSVPAERVVPPVYVLPLALLRVSVDVLELPSVTLPPPAMVPANVPGVV
jgi:hypothetical protein